MLAEQLAVRGHLGDARFEQVVEVATDQVALQHMGSFSTARRNSSKVSPDL
jgi:hypothetical protein